jgi:DNA-binding XRE family transcriptional regulator
VAKGSRSTSSTTGDYAWDDGRRSTPLPGLAKRRRRRGLTQRQLGELAGVAHTTVQRLETLGRGAYPSTVAKLAAALGVEPEDLTGDDRR